MSGISTIFISWQPKFTSQAIAPGSSSRWLGMQFPAARPQTLLATPPSFGPKAQTGFADRLREGDHGQPGQDRGGGVREQVLVHRHPVPRLDAPLVHVGRHHEAAPGTRRRLRISRPSTRRATRRRVGARRRRCHGSKKSAECNKHVDGEPNLESRRLWTCMLRMI